MYQILLLHDVPDRAARIQDYLRLSSCNVLEGRIEKASDYREWMESVDGILLYCDTATDYYNICEEIRTVTQTPVLVLSGESDEWVKIKMFQCGADDYLVEPFPQGELLARLRAHIERYRRLTRPFGYIEVNELKIDTFSRRVYINDEPVVFRSKEYEVLLYLAQRPNITVTKQEIYTAVWKDSLGEGYYNSVSVHIKRIRRKIEKDPENPRFLETVWGVGYRFRM